MPTTVDGVPPSEEVLIELASLGKPVMLNFSRGKDSIAAWIKLREYDIEVHAMHMYLVPGLEFIEESIAYFEDFFGQRIRQYPHFSTYRFLSNFIFQAPGNLAVIEAVPWLGDIGPDEVNQAALADAGLPEDTWWCDGVRAADSPLRRIAFMKYGAFREGTRRVSPIWDFLKAEVMHTIELAGCKLPKEYEWFGRSHDGIDARFMEPLSRFAPADYQRILEFFPLADIDIFRSELKD